MKRIILFVLTNLAVVAALGIVLSILRVAGILPPGNSYLGLLLFAAVWGFAGSLISLAMSKTIAKWSTGAKVIEQPRGEVESWLVATVHGQAQAAGVGVPEVAIYDSPDMNAFATGMSRNNALVAVSSGLLRNMQRDEVEAVLAHEVSHVANGDMITLALLQGVVNTFVIFLSRIVGMLVDSALSRGNERRSSGAGYFITVIVMEILLGILATIIVMWFSRRREFRADEGGAKLAGAHKMAAALERLKRSMPTELPSSMRAFGIAGGGKGFMNLFRSHPPLDERIERLRKLASSTPAPTPQRPNWT